MLLGLRRFSLGNIEREGVDKNRAEGVSRIVF